jgi:hypothetical protein
MNQLEKDVHDIKNYVSCIFWVFVGLPVAIIVAGILLSAFAGALSR